jgi:hypothetical protein
MGKFWSRADIGKNRLYVVLQGFIQADEAKEAADLTIAEAKKLRPGFDIINDISTVKATSEQGVMELLRCQVFLKERGVRRVIRVVPEVSVGSLQIARTSKQAGYEADTAASIEEAEAMLGDQKSK